MASHLARFGSAKAGSIQFSILLDWARKNQIDSMSAVLMSHAGVLGWVGGLDGKMSIGYLHGLSADEALKAAKALEGMGAI